MVSSVNIRSLMLPEQFSLNSYNFDLDPARIEKMVKRTFGTSRAYEEMKLKFANSDKPLNSFFN